MADGHLFNYASDGEKVPTGATLRLAVVGCGKSKTPHAAPAKDLYTGALFRAARAYVEAAGYDAWFVASARHGILAPIHVVTPYEATIEAKSPDELRQWVSLCDVRLRCIYGMGDWVHAGGTVDVDVFAGRAYADPLLDVWNRSGWVARAPHEGKQIGERLAAFKAAA